MLEIVRECAAAGQELLCAARRGPGDVTTGPGITNSIPLGETEEAAELVTAFEAATYQAEYVIHMGLLLMMPSTLASDCPCRSAWYEWRVGSERSAPSDESTTAASIALSLRPRRWAQLVR